MDQLPKSITHEAATIDSTGLLAVARHGQQIVDRTTKYLSTLPHPIEVIEELVAVISVSSSLIISLHRSIVRFNPPSNRNPFADSTNLKTRKLCPRTSFLYCLCTDVLAAWTEFQTKLEDAKSLKLFQPNDVGLVRVPRNAWVFVCGGEGNVMKMRSRLYVEKYRVRVLIEGVCWQGLRNLECRSTAEEEEYEELCKLLPLVAERLMGVWRDYKPRLQGKIEEGEKVEVVGDKASWEKEEASRAVEKLPNFKAPQLQRIEKKEDVRVTVVESKPLPVFKKELQQNFTNDLKKNFGKVTIHSTTSTDSFASSTATVTEDFVHETWLLRLTPAKRVLCSSSKFCGLQLSKRYTHSPESYYIKTSSLHTKPGELCAIAQLLQCRGNETPGEHEAQTQRKILQMGEDAQELIQRLLESNEKRDLADGFRRNWEVVGMLARPRNKISPTNKWYQIGGKKPAAEWVLVVRGETLGYVEKPKPVPVRVPQPSPGAHRVEALRNHPNTPGQRVLPNGQVVNGRIPFRAPMQVQGPHVLRHVEQKREMSAEDAEKKMKEILEDLLKYEGKEEEKP